MVDWSKCSDVESRPDILSGAWVVKGTRVPAAFVIANAEDGYTPEQISTGIYPGVPVSRARRLIQFARQYEAQSAGREPSVWARQAS